MSGRIKKGKTTVIDISAEEIENRRLLFNKSESSRGGGRWPVLVLPDDLTYAEIYGITIDEYCKDPILHAEAQIAGQKWVLENMETDYCDVSVDVIFAAVEVPSSFGCPIYEQKNARPWFHPWVKTAEDLKRLEKIDPLSNGLCALHNEWQQKYLEIAEQYPVRFRDGKEFFPLSSATPAMAVKIDADPFCLAADLMGASDFFPLLYENPSFVRDFVGILSEKLIQGIGKARQSVPNPGPVFVGSDYSPFISPDSYREFALPALQAMKKGLGAPMKLHHCMIPTGILPVILSELKPEVLNGFKANEKVAEEMRPIQEMAGGKLYLEPYLDGTRMMVQTEQEIYEDACSALKLFGKTGKFHLGAWASDGVTLESLKKLNAVKRASCDVG